MELLRDRRTEFDELGVQPIGISRDSPWTHIAWTQALDLDFGLLSDFNGDAVRASASRYDFRGFHDVARRTAFLVDEDGRHSQRVELRHRGSRTPRAAQACRALKASAEPG